MAEWYDPLRKHARRASREHPSYGEDTVLFYLIRSCQKETDKRTPGKASRPPDLRLFEKKKLSDVAGEIARNLAADGGQVDGIFAINQNEYEKLLATVGRYAGGNAHQYAADFLQHVLEVVVTGTRPSCAACKLQCRRRTRPECARCRRELGVEGPSNEYVFQAPFQAWVLTAVQHLISDDKRRWDVYMRWRRDLIVIDEARYASSVFAVDAHYDEVNAVVREMLGEVAKIKSGKERSVMTESICRKDVDDAVHEHLHELDSSLLGEVIEHRRFASDEEIGAHLGISASNVSTTRSNTRKELAQRDYRWGEILDFIFPHKSFSRALQQSSYSLAMPGTSD